MPVAIAATSPLLVTVATAVSDDDHRFRSDLIAGYPTAGSPQTARKVTPGIIASAGAH
jgi:hypothetical protein